LFPSSSLIDSIAKLLLGVFVVYMLHTAWLLYGFLNTKPCDGGEHCITSYLAARPRLQVNQHLHINNKRQVKVYIPEETRSNGSLYAVVYMHKAGVSPLDDSREVHYAAQLTTYIPPRHTEGQRNSNKVKCSLYSLKVPTRPDRPISHWRPHLSITVMSEAFTFNKAGLPSDVRRYMRVSQEGKQMMYLPLLLVNELSFRVKDLMEISIDTDYLPLTVSYEGISLRRFRFWIHLQDVVYSLRQFGFTEENIDEIKETLADSNLYLLVLTAVITLICEFLALKNDISSWRKKKNMAGMSRKSVLWRSLGTLLIFLHLLEETSLLVLLPVGLGACVEVHKGIVLFNSFSLIYIGVCGSDQVNKLDEEERKTVEYDSQVRAFFCWNLLHFVSVFVVSWCNLNDFLFRLPDTCPTWSILCVSVELFSHWPIYARRGEIITLYLTFCSRLYSSLVA
uniref:Lipid scramblase CLPTM1L n=1 Tax=Sphaeramia orbicularis TaxID=375764 RepID=A0A672Z789_9TELE